MWRRKDPEAEEFVAECERFLSGSYADHLDELGQPVPVWAWVNLLAHGSETLLRETVSRAGRADTLVRSDWRRAELFLVGELLDLVATGEFVLEELQRATLIPLELELASCSAAARWRPNVLVAKVLEALPDRSKRQRR